MGKKYELLSDQTIEVMGRTLYRIRSLISFGVVEKGELGGYVEGEHNLSQSGEAWVSGKARVFGEAWVSGEARVFGEAQVSGKARVFGEAWVSGEALNIIGLMYPVTITDHHIQWGCECRTPAEWKKYTLKAIAAEHGEAAAGHVRKYRAAILALAKAHGCKEPPHER